jgi:hypothetical protein
MSALNYRNSLNANNSVAVAFFDETKYCIRGIEEQVNHAGTSVKYQRFDTRKHKKTVRKVLFEEQKRQMKERAASSFPTDVAAVIEYYYDWSKFRDAILPYTKNERDRAIARGRKYAKEQEKENETEDGESSKGCGGRRRRRGRGRRRTRFSSLSSSRSPSSSSNDRSRKQHNTSDHDKIERRSQ